MEFSAKLITHRGERRIAVFFKKDKRMIARIKEFEDARWSAGRAAWHLPDTFENRNIFKIIQHQKPFRHLKALNRFPNSNNTSPPNGTVRIRSRLIAKRCVLFLFFIETRLLQKSLMKM